MPPVMPQDAVAPAGWRIGNHLLRADGTFWKGTSFINLTPLQRRLLRCFMSQAGELIEREQLALAGWNSTEVSDQSMARAIHCLRRVLDDSGLGGELIATLYGSGYAFTGSVEPLPNHLPPLPAAEANGDAHPSSAEARARAHEHHMEGLAVFLQRNPAQLPRAVRHLRCSFDLDPSGSALVDLCWAILHQAIWGLQPSNVAAEQIRDLLQQADQQPSVPPGLDNIRAEVLALLQWRPAESDRLYGALLPSQLPRGEAILSWARQLLATGRPRQALDLLLPHLDEELPLGWMLAGVAWFHLGQPEDALEFLASQLAIDPSLVTTQLISALIHASQGHRSEAIDNLQQTPVYSGRVSPAPAPHPIVAFVLARGDQQSRARAMLREASTTPAAALPSFWGLAALALEDGEAAARWFERALQRRCYLTPFLRQGPLLAPYEDEPVVQRFRASMDQAFQQLPWQA
jgi:DNA-binding winged helix-turn-helix (wHTH) protein